MLNGGIALSVKNLTDSEITANDIDTLILDLNKPDGTSFDMTANAITVDQNMDTFVNYRMDGMTASTDYNSVELTVGSSPLVIPANGSIIIGSIAGFTDLGSLVVHKAVFNESRRAVGITKLLFSD